jgi:hypothetical protein
MQYATLSDANFSKLGPSLPRTHGDDGSGTARSGLSNCSSRRGLLSVCGLQEYPGLGEHVVDGSGHVFVDLVVHGARGLCFFANIATGLTVETLLPMETTTKSTTTSSSSSGSADTTFVQVNVAAPRVLSAADHTGGSVEDIFSAR